MSGLKVAGEARDWELHRRLVDGMRREHKRKSTNMEPQVWAVMRKHACDELKVSHLRRQL